MKRTRSMVLALVAMFALSVAASAASAHVFKAGPTGGTFPAATEGTGGTQKFKAGFGTITCNAAKSTGRALKAEELTTEQTVEYSGSCKDNVGDAVTEPIKALYEISADEKVSILSPIVIKINGFANCTITIEKQNNLGGIKFKNVGTTELTVESTTTGIAQLGSGGFCTNGTGEYTGNVTGKLTAGGTLSWV